MGHQAPHAVALGRAERQDLQHFGDGLRDVRFPENALLPEGAHRVDRRGGVVEEELVDGAGCEEDVDGGEDVGLRAEVRFR